MRLSEATGTLKRFRKTPWKFQRTFKTPISNLQPFLTTIVTASPGFKAATVTVVQAVFEPENLNELLTRYSIPLNYDRGLSLVAADRQEAEALLLAALSDCVDFLFIPDPKSFAIYADHDEFATFYGQTRSNLNRAVSALSGKGFEFVPDYEIRL